MLVLLLSLLFFFEFLVTSFLMKKSTIKMNKITSALLQDEVLRWKNRASSLGGNSAMVVTREDGSRRRRGKGS